MAVAAIQARTPRNTTATSEAARTATARGRRLTASAGRTPGRSHGPAQLVQAPQVLGGDVRAHLADALPPVAEHVGQLDDAEGSRPGHDLEEDLVAARLEPAPHPLEDGATQDEVAAHRIGEADPQGPPGQPRGAVR